MYHLHTFSCTYFYSHPREGGDIEDSNFVERQYISIHAPAKGATLDTALKFIQTNISIHAPVKGATIPAYTRDFRQFDFYSRPREGGDMPSDAI